MKKNPFFTALILFVAAVILSSCAKKLVPLEPSGNLTHTATVASTAVTTVPSFTPTTAATQAAPPAVPVYDGDTASYTLVSGAVTNDAAGGSITETTGGNPGNLMSLNYINPGWWQQHEWNKTENVNVGSNVYFVFEIRQAPASAGAVNQFKIRLDWSAGGDVFVDTYVVGGGGVTTAWKTVKIPLSDLLLSGQTQVDFIAFISNYNSGYTVDVDNIRLEGSVPTATPTITETVNPLWTNTYTPTITPTGIFIHPGALNSQAELDFVKAKIAASQQPWKGEFDFLKLTAYANRTVHALTTVNSCTGDANTIRDDAIGAYLQALLWYYSGDTVYAERSAAILNGWKNLTAFTCGSDQDKLTAGWVGSVLANAAEIMRLYNGTTKLDMAGLKAMFQTAFYPQLNTMSTWNGNVDLTQIDAMTAIAVFCDDQAEFNAGISRLRTRVASYFYTYTSYTQIPPIAGDGNNIPAFWSNPAAWITGLQQETCRDNGHHVQFALGSALHAAETAWHQGTDVYTEMETPFTTALELLAHQLTSGSMQGTCTNNTPSTTRIDTWEIGYSHYHYRKGLTLSYTNQLITNSIRPSASRADWNICYETLTHAYSGN